MTTALGIAATTEVLRAILHTAVTESKLKDVLGSFSASTFAPGQIKVPEAAADNSLNLFLYQVIQNQGWRNLGLPVRDGNGDRVNSPPLALDLYYLMTAFAPDELSSQSLLATGMLALHELSLLTRDGIRAALSPPPPPQTDNRSDLVKKLVTAGLDKQIEAIKVSPHNLSLDDLNRILGSSIDRLRERGLPGYGGPAGEQPAHALGAAGATAAEPRRVPLQQPDDRRGGAAEYLPVTGATIILKGHDLLAGKTVVRFGSAAEQEPDVNASTPFALSVLLPVNVPAGMTTVQVVQQLAVGEGRRMDPVPPASLRHGFESNLMPLVIQPRIAKTGPSYDITKANESGAGTEPRSADITVGLEREVGKRQRATLLLNQKNAPASGPVRGYSFEAETRDLPGAPDTSATVTWSVNGVHAGTYLVRVRIDGAETPLELDADGKYDKPELSLSSANSAWHAANQACLAAELAVLRLGLARQAAKAASSPQPQTREDEVFAARDAARAEAAAHGPTALEIVSAAFALSPFERERAAAGGGIRARRGVRGGVPPRGGRRPPTFSLALAALPSSHWSALSPGGPLRHWRLIEVAAGQGLTSAPLRIDERILHYLAGVSHEDERLAGMASAERQPAEGLASSHAAVVEKTVGLWTRRGCGMAAAGDPVPGDGRRSPAQHRGQCGGRNGSGPQPDARRGAASRRGAAKPDREAVGTGGGA